MAARQAAVNQWACTDASRLVAQSTHAGKAVYRPRHGVDPNFGFRRATREPGVIGFPSGEQVAILGLVGVDTLAHTVAAVPGEGLTTAVSGQGLRSPIVGTSQRAAGTCAGTLYLAHSSAASPGIWTTRYRR